MIDWICIRNALRRGRKMVALRRLINLCMNRRRPGRLRRPTRSGKFLSSGLPASEPMPLGSHTMEFPRRITDRGRDPQGARRLHRVPAREEVRGHSLRGERPGEGEGGRHKVGTCPPRVGGGRLLGHEERRAGHQGLLQGVLHNRDRRREERGRREARRVPNQPSVLLCPDERLARRDRRARSHPSPGPGRTTPSGRSRPSGSSPTSRSSPPPQGGSKRRAAATSSRS